MTAHHEIGPSAASRWAYCTASVAHIRAIGGGEETDSDWSREGTWLHDLCATALELGVAPRAGRTNGEFTLDSASAESIAEAIEVLEEWDFDETYVEHRVDCSEVWPGMFGTLDFGGVRRKDPLLVVFDWKWGMGVPVSPVQNLQAACYAVGLAPAWMPDSAEVIFVIWQPRIPGAGGEWRTTMGWVREKARWLRSKAEEAMGPKGVYAPSEIACKFCPGATHDRCDALARWNLERFGALLPDLDADGLELERPEGMTNARRASVVRQAGMMRKWLKEVEGRLCVELQASGPAHGLKVVAGKKGDRKWTDEDAVARQVRAAGVDPYEKRLMTPAQIEKVVSTERYGKLKRYVSQAPGAPVLADVKDPRPAILPAADYLEDL